jgi:hypothetical protein
LLLQQIQSLLLLVLPLLFQWIHSRPLLTPLLLFQQIRSRLLRVHPLLFQWIHHHHRRPRVPVWHSSLLFSPASGDDDRESEGVREKKRAVWVPAQSLLPFTHVRSAFPNAFSHTPARPSVFRTSRRRPAVSQTSSSLSLVFPASVYARSTPSTAVSVESLSLLF